MDLTQAIKAVEGSGLENAGAIVDAMKSAQTQIATTTQQATELTQERDRLVDNNAKLLGQKGTANGKLKDLQERLSKVLSVVAEGEEDQEKQFEALEKLTEQIKALTKERDNAVKEKDEAIASKGELERGLKIEKAAAKLGITSLLMDKLLEIDPDKLIITDDGVKVKGEGDKELTWDEYLAKQPKEVQRVIQLAVKGEGDEGEGDGEGDSGEGDGEGEKRGPSAPPAKPPQKGKAGAYLKTAGFIGPSKKMGQ